MPETKQDIEAEVRQRAQKRFDKVSRRGRWPSTDSEAIVNFALSERLLVMEECCKLVCKWCASRPESLVRAKNGQITPDGHFAHFGPKSPSDSSACACDAAVIRQRMKELETSHE